MKFIGIRFFLFTELKRYAVLQTTTNGAKISHGCVEYLAAGGTVSQSNLICCHQDWHSVMDIFWHGWLWCYVGSLWWIRWATCAACVLLLSPFPGLFQAHSLCSFTLTPDLLLKLRLSTADPRDMKAPMNPSLTHQRDQNHRGTRLAITLSRTQWPSSYSNSSRPHALTHVTQCQLWGLQTFKHQRQKKSRVGVSSPQLRGNMAQIPREIPRSEADCRF